MKLQFYLTFSFTIIQNLYTFNLDTEYTILKTGKKGSLFGFSVTQHIDGKENWVLVGAPKDNSSFVTDRNTGAVYKCSATSASNDCTDQIDFDSVNANPVTERKEGEWMGVSLQSGGKDEEIITCAHRYTYKGRNSQFMLLEGRCYTVDSDFAKGIKISVCNNQLKTGQDKEIGQCESGIGVAQFKEKTAFAESYYAVGTVGLAHFRDGGLRAFAGTVRESSDNEHEYSVDNVKGDLADSYFGYAVTIGRFFDKSKYAVASGGPRHLSFGKVLIYNSGEKNLIQELPANLPEIQLASGYGIALASVDINGDGLDELVVGAPFYSSDHKFPNQGIAYVYTNSGGKLVLMTELKGAMRHSKNQGNNSFFGYAVENAGDINLDGYDDVIIGAPYENDNRGAIFIYMGSKDGLSEDDFQHIEASSIVSGINENIGLKGFGRSLAGGLDLDGNGYKDVLVGAFASDQAVLLRSRPVINVFTNITFEPNELQVLKNCTAKDGEQTTCFNIKFCYRFTEPSGKVYTDPSATLPIRFKIDADPSGKRVKFENGERKYEFTGKAKKDKSCESIDRLYLVLNKDGTVLVYPDVLFHVTQSLPYGDKDFKKPARSNSSVVNLDTYPFLRNIQKELDYQLKFKRECEKCVPDLSLITRQNYTIRLGQKFRLFNITLENKNKDPAYSVTLKLDLPADLRLEVVYIDNKRRYCRNSTCENLFYKFDFGQKTVIGIELDTRKFTEASDNKMKIQVTSLNEEEPNTLADNEAEITFEVKIDADIEVLEGKSTQQVLYSGEVKGESAMRILEDIGPFVEHRFAVRNIGPDLLPKALLKIQWPYEVVSGKHLLYLVAVNPTSQSTKCSVPARNVLNLAGSSQSSTSIQDALKDNKNTNSQLGKSRKRRDTNDNSTDSGDLDEKTKKLGLLLDCKTAECVEIVCDISNFKADSTEVVSVQSRLWQPTLLLDYYGEVISIQSSAQVSIGINATFINDPNLQNNEIEIYTVVTPVFPPKVKEKIAVWIIALAVIAGVILLVLLIVGLYKLGFFKRQKASGQYKKDADETKKPSIGKN